MSNKKKFKLSLVTSYSGCTNMTSTFTYSLNSEIYECEDEINKRLCKKKWYKTFLGDECVDVFDGILTFNREFGQEIYEKYRKKYVIDVNKITLKLDKYLIDVIDDILTKYKINKFICEGLLDDGTCDSDRIYKRNKSNGKWYSYKCI